MRMLARVTVAFGILLVSSGCEPESNVVMWPPEFSDEERRAYHESERYQRMMVHHCQMTGDDGRNYELWLHIEGIDDDGPLYCLSSFGDSLQCYRRVETVDGETYVGELNNEGVPGYYLKVTSTGEAIEYSSYMDRDFVDGELVDIGLQENTSTGTCENGRAH